jgi:hypothetical protein
MAKIVLGIRTSHSPQLSVPGDLWDIYAKRDKRNPGLYRIPDGKHVSYEELMGDTVSLSRRSFGDSDAFPRNAVDYPLREGSIKVVIAEKFQQPCKERGEEKPCPYKSASISSY